MVHRSPISCLRQMSFLWRIFISISISGHGQGKRGRKPHSNGNLREPNQTFHIEYLILNESFTILNTRFGYNRKRHKHLTDYKYWPGIWPSSQSDKLTRQRRPKFEPRQGRALDIFGCVPPALWVCFGVGSFYRCDLHVFNQSINQWKRISKQQWIQYSP
jgi:hypothetical protein